MAGGRQREFDKQQALDKAMRVFWQKGYLAASLTELTGAMGINKPSMYAAFGNKESLFVQASQHYIDTYASKHALQLNSDGNLRSRLKAYVLSIIKAQCASETPKGCYVALCASEATDPSFPSSAKGVVSNARDVTESNLVAFLDSERHQLVENTDIHALALLIVSFTHGSAAMARAGRSVAELSAALDLLLLTIPSKPE